MDIVRHGSNQNVQPKDHATVPEPQAGTGVLPNGDPHAAPTGQHETAAVAQIFMATPRAARHVETCRRSSAGADRPPPQVQRAGGKEAQRNSNVALRPAALAKAPDR